MGHSPKPSSNSYKLFGIISKVTSLAEVYRAFARKLHPRAHSQSKFTSINEAYRAISSNRRWRDGETTSDSGEKTPERSKQYEEEELVISSPKLLSRTTSRIAPKLQRTASVSSSTAPAFLSKTLSQRNTNTHIVFSESKAGGKPAPVEKRLECALEELCYGCTKEVKITRETRGGTTCGRLIFQEEEYVTIKVQPGWRRGTKIAFEGNEDIIFVIEEKKHPVFKREGDDLELGVQIPLVQALTGCTINIPTLGGGKMVLNLDDEIIHPGFEKTVPGQGMPKHKDQGGRGDLRLRFLVGFPTDLSEEQRSQVATILKDCC